MYTTWQGKVRQGVVEIAYEVTHPVEEEKDTPGLIFVGGWGESGRTWRQQVAFFAPRFPTLTYDRRGLGQSSRPDHQDAYTVEQNGVAPLARTRILETPTGKLLLQDHCQPSFVESLRVDSGLHAFARRPEREHQLLISIAKRPDCRLILAYTPEGVIVAEVTLAPGDAWWAGLEHVYEGAVQVSSNWRRLGIARQLLSFALELDMLEDMIIFALGLSWHWDAEGLGLNRFQYRKLIGQLFAAYGFVEYLTSEPNITMDPANIFLARIGSRVNLQAINQFYNRMLSSQNLPGL